MKNRQGGFIDIVSLVAVVFLVLTTVTGVIVTNKQNANFDIRNKAATTCDTTIHLNTAGTCPDGVTIKYIHWASDCINTVTDECTGSQNTTACTVARLNTAGTCPDGVTVKYVWRNADCSETTDTCPDSPIPQDTPSNTETEPETVTPQTTTKPITPPKTTTAPDIPDGTCLEPGESCQNGNYFDIGCPVTETRCGTKPVRTTCNVSYISDLGCGKGGCKDSELAQYWKATDCLEKIRCVASSGCATSGNANAPQCSGTQKQCSGTELQICSGGIWISQHCANGCANGACNQPAAVAVQTQTTASQTTNTPACSLGGTTALCGSLTCCDGSTKVTGMYGYCNCQTTSTVQTQTTVTPPPSNSSTYTLNIACKTCNENKQCVTRVKPCNEDLNQCKTHEQCGTVWICQTNETQCLDTTTLQTCKSDQTGWLSKTCEYGCENNACKAKSLLANGELCNSNVECQSNNCYATGEYYQSITGSGISTGIAPTNSQNRCHAATTTEMQTVQKAEIAGNLAGTALAGTLIAAPVVAPAVTQIATGLGSAATLAYINATNTMAQSPILNSPIVKTAINVLNLAQAPLAIITCETQGQDSEACLMAKGGIVAEFQANPAGMIESLSASAQQVQSVAQSGISKLTTAATNMIDNLANSSIGDTLFGNSSITNLNAPIGPTLANPQGLKSSGQLRQNWVQEVSNHNDARYITYEEELTNKLNQVENLNFDEATVKVLDKQTIAGRQVLEVELPTGDSLLCYRSTGTCTPGLKKLGDWQVIAGFADDGWFIKTQDTIGLVKPGGNPFAIDMTNYLHNNELLFFPELIK